VSCGPVLLCQCRRRPVLESRSAYSRCGAAQAPSRSAMYSTTRAAHGPGCWRETVRVCKRDPRMSRCFDRLTAATVMFAQLRPSSVDCQRRCFDWSIAVISTFWWRDAMSLSRSKGRVNRTGPSIARLLRSRPSGPRAVASALSLFRVPASSSASWSSPGDSNRAALPRCCDISHPLFPSALSKKPRATNEAGQNHCACHEGT
jgi:hypothetical protein